jgi:hypothetical protein
VPEIIVPKILAMRKDAGCLDLQVADFGSEEDRAANEWLAGNNAAFKQNDACLHGAILSGTAPESKPK